MSKILLIAPPYETLYGGSNIKKLQWGFIPYGIASIGGKLRSEGHKVRIVDVTWSLKNLYELKDIIRDESPDYMGVSVTTPQVVVSLEICKMAKRIKPDCTIIVGGPHASALPEEMLLNKDIDIVVYGEGEVTMSLIARGADLPLIKGVYYRDKGVIVKNEPQPLIEDLDSLPFPLYEQLPIERYGTPYMGRSVGIITGRGCPCNCTFCASKIMFGKKYRFRNVASILKEILWFKQKYGILIFSFWDDTFTINKKEVENLCVQLIENRVNIKWSCTTRVDAISRGLLGLMKKAGCFIVHLGIESGDEVVLNKTRKGITLRQAEAAVKCVRELQIEAYGYFILGLPYETKQTLRRTIEFAKKLKLDYAQFSLLTPLPGTEIWDLAKEGRILRLTTSDFARFNRYGKAVIELPGLTSEELNKYYKKAYIEFYFRWKYVLQVSRKINSLKSIIRYFKMLLNFLKFLF
ncbi:MAG: radical SAM protein [Candidatus Omnitrophica bacterium]|nr:radical SAM protein [Candidatus Omnitrophota bacterium]